MDFSSFSEWIPAITGTISTAAAIASVLPKPSDPTSPAGLAYNLVNALGMNVGKAKNASDLSRGAVATINGMVQTMAPQAAPVIAGSEMAAQVIATAYLAGHQTGQGAQVARVVLDALHPPQNG
ncbi:MAG: hypothetical protein HQM06_13860 [Magnetococcales bacterium]|nr:hypothetical protein [Magnetococcales bacterium]